MSQPTAEDIAKWHRWFAVECNNRGWDLVNQAVRTEQDDAELLHVAHAAAHHWSKSGQPIHEIRADELLVFAFIKTGQAETAMTLGQRVLGQLSENDDHAEAWDWAFAHAGLAAAAEALDDHDLHRKHYEQAIAAANRIENPKDRQVFNDQFPRLTPAPA